MRRFPLIASLPCLALAGSGCAARPPQPAVASGDATAPGAISGAASQPVCAAAPAPAPAPAPRVEFAQLQPILDRCQPCHFPGGVMYEQLPFDQPQTIVALGEKLFTRIEVEQERALIRAFLAEAIRQ